MKTTSLTFEPGEANSAQCASDPNGVATRPALSSHASTLQRFNASTHPSFTIPPCDHDLFANLPDRARKLVKRRLRAMQTIDRAKNPWAGAQAVAAMFHGERGWSAKRLDALYGEFTEAGGNWRALVDAALAGPAWQNHLTPIGLPDAFLDHLASRWAQNQRDKFMSVYSALLI